MPERLHRRLGGHLRRHGIAYAALTLAVTFSPLPSAAADLVTTAEIANGAVTAPKLAGDSVFSSTVADDSLKTADIKDGNVTYADLSTSARGAKVYRYDLGDHNFGGGGVLLVQLPGTWTAAKVRNSAWTASLLYAENGVYYSVPGDGYLAATHYRILVTDTGVLQIDGGGPGEAYADIRVFRTVATDAPSTGIPGAKPSSRSLD